jgi:hypothetical protein
MFNAREVEIMSQINGSDERWENWLQHTQSRLVKPFTKNGFELVKTPSEVQVLLRDVIDKAVAEWDSIREEHKVDVIYHPEDSVPRFVDLGPLNAKIHKLLLPYHEAWAGGIKLVPTSAYGVRLYRNQSSLVMHVDKVQSHVISSIVHVAHEYDNDDEPWPLNIEGHDGKMHTVRQEAGYMVFYESAKCLHGRIGRFKGKYYASIFVHYRPADPNEWVYTKEDVIQAVPPHWYDGVDHDYGARWAGCSVTVDSRVAEGAPPRFPNEREARMKLRKTKARSEL